MSTKVVEGCGVTVEGDGAGPIFVTNAPAAVHLKRPGQSCWARHLNPEGTSDTGLVTNNGGKLWIVGTKSEVKGRRFVVENKGQTVVFGAYEYTTDTVEADDLRPMFLADNAELFAAPVFEVCFHGKPYNVKAEERRSAGSRGSWTERHCTTGTGAC